MSVLCTLGDGVNSTIFDMEVYEDELYVVGNFSRVGEGVEWWSNNGGTPCGGVAKWNGSTWTCLIDELEPDGGRFNTVEIYNDTLYAGGDFGSLYGDTAMSMIAMLPLNSVPVSVNEFEKKEIFSLYPNPTSDIINLNFHEVINSRSKVIMYNTLGEAVLEMKLTAGQKGYTIDVTQISEGMYSLEVYLEEKRWSKKVVVSR